MHNGHYSPCLCWKQQQQWWRERTEKYLRPKSARKTNFLLVFSAMIKLHHTKKNSKKSYNKWKIKGFVDTKQRTIHIRYFVNCFRPFIIPGYPFRYDRTRFGCSLETMLISLRFIQKKVVYKLWK